MTVDQKMAPLPRNRLEPSPPFTYVGADCVGPFVVTEGRKQIKRYGVLFTCMASRAVHIEMVQDLSSDSYINALRCLFAIRGPAKTVYSDNGTNFVGASNELSNALQHVKSDEVRQFLLSNKCDFVFNIPGASHMGGWWERQIRTVRSILTFALDKSDGRLNSNSLRTFLYEVMAIVNSRPISTEGLYDPTTDPLSPNQILTKKTAILTQPGEFQEDDLYSSKMWRRVQSMAQMFWKRWRAEYLTSLQKKSKWEIKRPNLKVGDIVMLKEDDLLRSNWRLACVDRAYESKDGLVRKLRLRIGSSDDNTRSKKLLIERPVHKVVLLHRYKGSVP